MRRVERGATLLRLAALAPGLPAFALSVLLLSCGANDMSNQKRSFDPDAMGRAIDKASGLAILFGHQSVGSNLLQGVEDICLEAGKAPLRLVEAPMPIKVAGPGLYHFPIGANGDPESKIRAFAAALRSGDAAGARIAAMKFCYADVGASTDIEALFESYRKTMAELRAERPGLKILHITVPLESDDGALKAAVKSLLGRRPRGRADNLAKERYNALLRAEYEGKEPIFDIAEFESASAEGGRLMGGSGKKAYPVLRPEYSGDGGHLNAAGRRWVAGHFLLALASFQ